MDSIRISKVEGVSLVKAGQSSVGTLHLTAHHLIFRHETGGSEEMWISYPLLALITRQPQDLRGQSSLSIRTRTFDIFSLSFQHDTETEDVFDSIKELTVVSSLDKLYAFYYQPQPPLASQDGWNVYSPREEFGRMGVGVRSRAWRFTDINKDYSFSPTYPARLVVPTRISDTTLQYACKYRSKARIPALSYLHWANYASITRSSQPMVGLTANRSVQDEKLIEAVFHSHHSPESKVSASPVYGATATNLIIDARPTTNAVANTAKGAGTENMDNYKEAKKAYLGIDNIHVVRDALGKVVDCLYQADVLSRAAGELSTDGTITAFVDRQALRRSGWLKLLSAILEGTLLITRNVHVNSSHVLIHCSDGWDRTAQLSALSQLCLDPYYRTIKGFQVLVEKDWVSFGHRFMDRCGHLSSDKFFVSSNENTSGGGGSAEAAQAFFASVQNRFVSQGHLKEMSPVFHQFLECVRQIQRQYPTRFEFNERFLRQLHTHLYSCQFGNFLYNCERERRQPDDTGRPPWQRTTSIWDFVNSPSELELSRNPDYDKSLDDPANREPKADMGVLFVNTKDIRFWHELYGCTDEEMNGKMPIPANSNVELVIPVEAGSEDPVLQATNPLLAMSSQAEDESPPSATGSSFADAGSDVPSSQSTLRPRSEPTHRDSASSPSSQRGIATANTQELLGAGVKSVWGRLSSNASAAFSVVQGAYDGVARDFKTMSVAGEESSSSAEGGGELRARERPSDWNTPGRSGSTPATVASSTNVWASTKQAARIPSLFAENPWNTARPASSPPSRAPLSDSMWAGHESGLPHDPTIVDPASLSHANPAISRAPSDINPWATGTVRGAPNPRPQQSGEAPAAGGRSGTDPLGIGPL